MPSSGVPFALRKVGKPGVPSRGRCFSVAASLLRTGKWSKPASSCAGSAPSSPFYRTGADDIASFGLHPRPPRARPRRQPAPRRTPRLIGEKRNSQVASLAANDRDDNPPLRELLEANQSPPAPRRTTSLTPSSHPAFRTLRAFRTRSRNNLLARRETACHSTPSRMSCSKRRAIHDAGERIPAWSYGR